MPTETVRVQLTNCQVFIIARDFMNLKVLEFFGRQLHAHDFGGGNRISERDSTDNGNSNGFTGPPGSTVEQP